MATNYTEKLQLCQWEPDDYVLREDFNADNVKIENAYAALEAAVDSKLTEADTKLEEFREEVASAGIKLIREMSSSTTALTISFDVSDIDFTLYKYVLMDVSWNGGGIDDSANLRINGRTADDHYYSIGSTNAATSCCCCMSNDEANITFNLRGKSHIGVTNDYTTKPGIFGVSLVAPSDINTIDFVSWSSATGLSNLKIKLWGIK